MDAINQLTDGTVEPLWLVIGTFLYCIASGFIFFLNAEVFLLAVAAVSPPRAAIPLLLAATSGQMIAKSTIYLAGRGVLSLPVGRNQGRLKSVGERLKASRMGPAGFILLSSITGFPPFYVVSILAGTLRIPFPVFFVPGTSGRLIRFGILIFFPQLAKGVFQ